MHVGFQTQANTTICIELAFQSPHEWGGTTICGQATNFPGIHFLQIAKLFHHGCLPMRPLRASALQEQFYRWSNAGPREKASTARADTTVSRGGAAPAGLIFRSGL
jgi:hypothetical protein